MKKILFVLAFIVVVVSAETITGSVIEGGSPHIAAVSPKVCDENPNDICLFLCSTPWSFSIDPPTDCHFSPDTDYFVSTSVPTISGSDAYQAPGDPVALVGPFHVDVSGNADLGSFHEITSGGFSGTIYNADAKFVVIDSIKILIEHHYLGQNLSSGDPIDYYGSPTVVSPESVTPLGGGDYSYNITGFPSGGKRITFFDDANGNNALDAGELTAELGRDVGIVGEQYDDSVDVDLLTLHIAQKSVRPKTTLLTAAPNPFNSTVQINIANFLPGEHLFITDVSGKIVKIMCAEKHLVWDAKDDNGDVVPTGVYFAALEHSRNIRVRMCLIK